MKKFLISIIWALCVGAAFASGENVATSKAFVDTAVAQKQDKIPANSGAAQVLTNTGEQGAVGTKDIYDSSVAYVDQTDSLIDAATMNAAVQNAIDAEFECVSWVDNDPTKDCLLVNIFSAPPRSILPTGYTALEYIESTGTQYIDTGIVGNQDIKVDITFRATGRTQNFMLFGARINAYTRALAIWGYSGFLDSAFRMGFGSSAGYTGPNATTEKYHVVLSRNGAFINDSFVWNPNIQENFVTPYSLKLFAVQSEGDLRTTAMQLFSFSLYNTDVLIQNLVPARRDGDGKVGLYDTVTNTFFTNAGTGDFIAGPVQNLYLPSGN